MSQKPTVELHAAHVWTCDECGLDNFCRAVTYEPTEDELPGLLQSAGIDRVDYDIWIADPNNGGIFTTAPTEVACEHCGAEFGVETDEPEDS